MSNYQLRPASPSSAKLLFGIYSESGNGKTLSALLLALGFVGPTGRIAMIETESGRGEIYQDSDLSAMEGVVVPPPFAGTVLRYEVVSMVGSFSPEEYGKAITAAEDAKVDALIIDSGSHEWESVGGVLDMAAKNQEKGNKGPLVWQKPKMDHQKHFVLRLMSSPIPLIVLDMRAKYPMYQIKQQHVDAWRAAGGRGKPPEVGDWARSSQLEPKQSEDILYEMLIHGWLDEEHRFHVTKYPKAIPALRDVVKNGEPLGIETGVRLAAWAAGRITKASNNAGAAPAATAGKPGAGTGAAAPTDDEIIQKLETAKNLDELAEARELARSIKDPQKQARANTASKASLARLRPQTTGG